MSTSHMTPDDLQRCDAELTRLVPAPDATAVAREQARAFNASVDDVRAALLEPLRDLLERGRPVNDLPACLRKAVAELVFWRRVLVGVHGASLGPAPAQSDCLLRYVIS